MFVSSLGQALPIATGMPSAAEFAALWDLPPGTVPGTGKRYLVDASASQTGRDPEPLLSVTARLVDR